MTLRVAIKYISFALLFECIVMLFKHPLMLSEPFITQHFGQLTYELLMTGYDPCFVIVQSVIYLAFCYHIHVLDIQFTDAFFGRFFRIEMALTLLNVAISVYGFMSGFEKLVYAYFVKITLEVGFAVNCVFAGITIYKYFRTEAMKKIRLSYFLWSARHLLYGIVLINDTLGIMNNTRPAPTNGTIITYWFLLMPILIYSRIVLIKGCSEFAALPPSELVAPEPEEN